MGKKVKKKKKQEKTITNYTISSEQHSPPPEIADCLFLPANDSVNKMATDFIVGFVKTRGARWVINSFLFPKCKSSPVRLPPAGFATWSTASRRRPGRDRKKATATLTPWRWRTTTDDSICVWLGGLRSPRSPCRLQCGESYSDSSWKQIKYRLETTQWQH